MEIRSLTDKDVNDYFAIRLRALKEEPDSFGSTYEEAAARPIETVAEMLVRPNTFMLGGYVEKKLVGIIGFERKARTKTAHQGLIMGVYLASECRGKGFGKALLKETLKRAFALEGLEQVLLSVVTTNEAACALYVATGFVPYGLEVRALKIGDRYLDQQHMVLHREAYQSSCRTSGASKDHP